MTKAPLIAAILCSIPLGGCVFPGKAAKPVATVPAPPKPVASAPPPAPPPAPLSIPQTQVDLPKPQPIDPAALPSEQPAAAEAPADQAPRPQQVRRPTPRPEVATPPAPAATPPAATSVTTEPPSSPPIQEIIPPAESKKLLEQARARRATVQQILDQFARKQVTGPQRDTITRINSFMQGSVEAENKGDMRQADALADRAQILAKDLINAK